MERTAGNKKGIEYGMRERKTTAFWGGDLKGSYYFCSAGSDREEVRTSAV